VSEPTGKDAGDVLDALLSLRQRLRARVSEVQRLQAEITTLRAALREACELLDEINAYCPDYFSDKWDHKGRIAELRKLVEVKP